MARPAPKKDEAGPCEISGCDKDTARSLSRKKVDKALSHGLEGSGKRVKLCKDHYKEFKKKTKEEKKLESLGW